MKIASESTPGLELKRTENLELVGASTGDLSTESISTGGVLAESTPSPSPSPWSGPSVPLKDENTRQNHKLCVLGTVDGENSE